MNYEAVTHYTLASNPRNRSIIDVTNKRTGELSFMKLRHKLQSCYAISLVDPKTFDVYVEVEARHVTARERTITLKKGGVDRVVPFRETARIGFEWSFEWNDQKYRWIRESRLSNELECRRSRKSGGDVCVAKYMPRGIKNAYFGLFSVLGYNMNEHDTSNGGGGGGLELILCISLLTMLDKADESTWSLRRSSNMNTNLLLDDDALPPEPTIDKKKQERVERENEQRLQAMLEKDLRRSQKQILQDDRRMRSAGNSPASSPQGSPLPTPTQSTSTSRRPSNGYPHQHLFHPAPPPPPPPQPQDELVHMLANLKHLDATATLQLPSHHHHYTNSSYYQRQPALDSLFSPPSAATTTTAAAAAAAAAAATASVTTATPTLTSAVTNLPSTAATTSNLPNTASPSHYFYYYKQQQQQQQAAVLHAHPHTPKKPASANARKNVRYSQPPPSATEAAGVTRRPTQQRRVSTGAALADHPQQAMYPWYPQYGGKRYTDYGYSYNPNL